jgi:methylase of polypeptide subunit release factors
VDGAHPAADIPSLDGLLRLRDHLTGCGYTEHGLAEVLRVTPTEVVGAAAPVVVDAYGTPDALAVLARLFLTGGGVDTATAETTLAPLALSELVADGLVAVVDDRVEGVVLAVPWRGLLVFGDGQRASGRDYVAPASAPSLLLADLASNVPVASALDVGTGSGLLALLTASHSDAVVATDVNPRALEWAARNARLNDVDTLELLEGSWFEPVTDRRYDLVVTNPPYVISPESTLLYRDSGLRGDDLGRLTVRDAAAHLNEGGFAYLLCNWAHGTSEHWTAPLRSWLDDTGCDALLLRHESEDPARYAYGWLRMTHASLSPVDGAVHHWLDYYRELGIERIASGAIVLRRRSDGSPWTQALDLPLPLLGSASEQVVRIFAGRDELGRRIDDKAVLAGTYEVVEPSRLMQTVSWEDRSVRMGMATLAAGEGIPFSVDVPADMVHILLRLDPTQPLGDTVEDTAEETGLDPDRLLAEAADALRTLLAHGMVRPMPH